MDTISKLSDYACMTGSDIKFMGVPKTIDLSLIHISSAVRKKKGCWPHMTGRWTLQTGPRLPRLSPGAGTKHNAVGP